MNCTIQADIGPKKNILTNSDEACVQNEEIEIEEASFSHLEIQAVIY
jgi:hypothetical protein